MITKSSEQFDARGNSARLVRVSERGVALLAVLWLTVALTFIAMATAHMVRTEVEAVSNQIDRQRDYFLARGGIEAAAFSIATYAPDTLSQQTDIGSGPQFAPGKRWLQYRFATGSVAVEIMPENAKLNVNTAPPELLASLFGNLGVSPQGSADLADAILEWRSPRTSEAGTPLDMYYSSLPSPYPARHARLEQLEELLPVRGMTRDLFFGHLERTSDGQWRKWPPLADLLTTQPLGNAVNPNFAPLEILRILPGWSNAAAAAAIAARTRTPFANLDELQGTVPGLDPLTSLQLLTLAQGPVYTLTATAISPGSEVRRSVRALVYISLSLPLYHRVLGWWDDWPSPDDLPQPPASNDHSGSDKQI